MALKDWERVGERDEYINNKTGVQIVQITPLNGYHKGELGVSIRTKEDSNGLRTIISERYFGKFSYGLNKDQPSQKKADSFMENYMRKH